MTRVHALAVLAAVTGFAFTAGPAYADAIDGLWCKESGLRMSIRGPEIITPGGTRTQGDYSRHAFSYVVPAGESGAGGTIQMRLLNEDAVQVRDTPQSNGEIWRRCGMPISVLRIGPATLFG
jgi:hypothetical protein